MPADVSPYSTISELGALLRRGETTSAALTELFLRRLETVGRGLNAVVRVLRESALAEAAAADRELAAGRDRGPLHGIPYGAKDLLAVRGFPTTWGAAPFQSQQFDFDATIVVKLRNAGAVLAAKLAMVEIAGGLGYSQANASFTGPGLNPWDRGRWSGGSSSGSGSAVGAGCVPFSIGSETWGSIVTPAGYCGVTGLRPTYGRVSRHGAMALSWSLDKLGPLTRTAEDAALVLKAIAGPDLLDPTAVDRPCDLTPPAFPCRLALVKGGHERTHPDVRADFERALEVLKPFAQIEPIDLPDLPWSDVAGTIIDCEMAAAFEGLVSSGDVWELRAPEDRYGGHAVQLIPAKDYINAQRIRAIGQRALAETLKEFDAIVGPTLPTVAPPIDRPFAESSGGFRTSALGGAGNAAGLPAVTVPSGADAGGLPTAIQFVGRPFEEGRILGIAAEFQRRTAHHRRTPPDP